MTKFQKSGKSQGILLSEIHFSQVEDPNFENFGLRLTVEPNLGLEK